jgi:hypothetical protein
VRRLRSVDHSFFALTLKQFWLFFDANPTFLGIVEDLLVRYPSADEEANLVMQGDGHYGTGEDEHAALSYLVCRKLSEDKDHQAFVRVAHGIGSSSTSYADHLESVLELYLDPFYEYVDEHLDDERAILALLRRYKRRCEWFHHERLLQLSEEGERQLALDLYGYLHDQGLNFTIEPSSLRGKVDLIAAQGTDDPLLADTKIFDGGARGKSYLQKGFRQIYNYAVQFNEPVGYLVIYKTCKEDLSFAVPKQIGGTPIVVHNHKTFFFITIDIHDYEQPVSKRGQLETIEITAEDLIQVLSEN